MIKVEEEERSSMAESSTTDSYVQPLLVRFNPPAFRQRHAMVRDTLKSMRPRCQSLLDIGTGDGSLLIYLTNCDDNVPITKLHGIDPDPEEIEEAALNTRPYTYHEENLRWRPLDISLFRGALAELTSAPGLYDCITTIEVLEHLDPPDVHALPQVCLQRLRPRCWIVTTPNRDFNSVFERIDECGQHFRRDGVEYPMRHDDHRFEMSRNEFSQWAMNAAEKYGYDVRFTGVGTVLNAFQGQTHWKRVFPETDLNHAFGFSTQTAIFTCRASSRSVTKSSTSPFDNLMHVATHTYPYSTEDMYPPSPQMTAQLVLAAESLFRPPFRAEANYGHQKTSVQLIDCKEFFETCYAIRRMARFNFDVFFESIRPLLGQVLKPGKLFDRESEPESESSAFEWKSEQEPRAVLATAEVVVVDDWRTCIKYTFSVFASSTANSYEESDSASTIFGDWNLARATEPCDTTSWTQLDDTYSFASLNDRDWGYVDHDSMLTKYIADMSIMLE